MTNRTSILLRYGVAVLSIVLAVGGRLLLDPLVGSGFPFQLVFFAILATAWFCGFGPTILAVVLGGLGVDYFLLPPRYSLILAGPNEWVGMVIYFCTGFGIALLARKMEAASGQHLQESPPSLLAGYATERKIQAGFVFILACLLVTGIVALTSSRQAAKEADLTRHTEEVIASLHRLLSTNTDAETSERGYVITGSESYLEPYYAAQQGMQGQMDGLRQLTMDNAGQQRKLDILEPIIKNRMEQVTKLIRLFDSQGFDTAQKAEIVGQGKKLQDSIRTIIADMERTEQKLLDARRKTASRTASTSHLLIGGSCLAAFAVVAVALYLIRRDFARTRRAEAALVEANERLESRVCERTAALAESRQVFQQSEERLQTVIDHMTEGLVIFSPDGRLIQSNRAVMEMCDYSDPAEWKQTLAEFHEIFEMSSLDNELQPLEKWPIARVFAGENLRHLEARIRRKGMDWMRIFSYSGSLVREPGGSQIAFLTITDMTALKEADEEVRRLNAELEQRVIDRTAQLEAANKELEAFSYSVSHDLRAPLRAVNGFAEIVLEDFGSHLPEEGRQHLERIRNGGQRMGELIDDLLEFARLSRQPVNRRTVQVEEMVKDVIDEMQPQLAGRQIAFQIGKLPKIEADPSLLRQVWVNLLSNAVKYSTERENATVEIGCQRTENEDVWFVKDDGTGFDMRYANKLFGVFQRLHRADQFPGTGVGLAIVQRIIHRHGGRIWAEAEINKGATFSFTMLEKNQL